MNASTPAKLGLSLCRCLAFSGLAWIAISWVELVVVRVIKNCRVLWRGEKEDGKTSPRPTRQQAAGMARDDNEGEGGKGNEAEEDEEACRLIRRFDAGAQEYHTIHYLPSLKHRREPLFILPTFVSDWMQGYLKGGPRTQKQNIFMATVLVNVLLTSLPCAMLLFVVCWGKNYSDLSCHSAGAIYLVVHRACYARSFALFLHYAVHTPIFRADQLNMVISHFVCAMFGVFPGHYYYHHVKNHHLEDNTLPRDLSSTMPYDRSRSLHMYAYIASFVYGLYCGLPGALQKDARFYVLAAETCAYLLFLAVLSDLCPLGTVYVFGCNIFYSGFNRAKVNWSQHLFVNPLIGEALVGEQDSSRGGLTSVDRKRIYSLTYSCINVPEYNYTAFNDGYHVEHHLVHGQPWFGLPASLDFAEYVRHDGILFDGIDFNGVRELVLAGDLHSLARLHYVNFHLRSESEVVEMLKSRLQPTHVVERSTAVL